MGLGPVRRDRPRFRSRMSSALNLSWTSQRPFPGNDLDRGLAGDIAGEELVGNQDDPVDAPLAGRMLPPLARHRRWVQTDVGLSFDLGRGVHIGHYRQTREAPLAQKANIGPGDRGGEARSRPVKVWEIVDRLIRREDSSRVSAMKWTPA